jgi:hypothetical protein
MVYHELIATGSFMHHAEAFMHDAASCHKNILKQQTIYARVDLESVNFLIDSLISLDNLQYIKDANMYIASNMDRCSYSQLG